MKPYYGTVFKVQREHSPEDLRRYLEDIRACGMNLVVVWPSVYWWEDRAKPGYPYNTGRAILRYAHELGLSIVMETGGQLTSLEAAPDFVMKDAYYPVRMDGSREWRGPDYGYLNYFHPEVASLIEKQLTEICEAYREFPALYGYDIFNETMFSSFDRYTLERFRAWLREKYGCIERLNAAWDRVYYNWSQIEFTQWTWASVMPYVDQAEFMKDAIGIQLRAWREIVRRADPDHPTIADNLYSMLNPDSSAFRPTDEWVTDASVDELGMSFYPKNGIPAFAPHKRMEMLRGFAAASKDGRFWVSEMQTHNQSMFRPVTAVSPEELRRWTLECYAAGCRGVIYWKWHPFIKGIQTGGRGLVDYRGRETPRLKAAREIGRLLGEHAELIGGTKPQTPRAAILYDRENAAFHGAYLHGYPQLPRYQYLESIEGVFQCLYEENIPATFFRREDLEAGRLDSYAALFITGQLVVGEALAEGMKRYVAQGGVIIIDGKFGFIGQDGILHDSIPGGRALSGVLGLDWRDIDHEGMRVEGEMDGEPIALDGYYERQLMAFEESAKERPEVLGVFSDGYPGLIRRRYGSGAFLYLPTALWYGYRAGASASARGFAALLARVLGLRTYELEGNLRVCVNSGERDILIYAFNDEPQTQAATLRLPVASACGVTALDTGSPVAAGLEEGLLAIPLEVAGGGAALYHVKLSGEEC